MTPTKTHSDIGLRRYALDNLRDTLRRMRYADSPTPTSGVAAELNWRRDELTKAAQWATIAEALRPDPPTYRNTFQQGDTS